MPRTKKKRKSPSKVRRAARRAEERKLRERQNTSTPAAKPTGGSTFYEKRRSALKSIGFATYPEYLSSETWANVKSRVMERDHRQCRLCNASEAYTAHHMKYTVAALAGDDISEIYSICKSCHYYIEFDGEKKLTNPGVISDRMAKRLKRKTGAKRAAKKVRAKCRCCGGTKNIGRLQICLGCYKAHREKVHEIADARDGGFGA